MPKSCEKKHHYGKGGGNKSKGWGLIQFEERESVNKALALNDIVGLHEKLLKIDRSHMPAASLVPPGMHRVGEYGQGKVSKRNEKKRREQQKGKRKKMRISEDGHSQHPTGDDNDNKESSQQPGSPLAPPLPSKGDSTEKPHDERTSSDKNKVVVAKKNSSVSVLSFRPRGVTARKSHPKQRLKFNNDD